MLLHINKVLISVILMINKNFLLKLHKLSLMIALILIIPLNYSCLSKKMKHVDLTKDIISKIDASNQDTIATTIKELLNIYVADKIYINYAQFNFPNNQWSNQKDFLWDMKLTVKNNEKLIFSDTLTSFFIINENEITEQYVLQSDVVYMAPEWYSSLTAYLAGVWNTYLNFPSDSVIILTNKMEIIVSGTILFE